MTVRWATGDQILVRSIWNGRVRAAWPDTVVSDTEHLLALYLASGTRFNRADSRMPVGNRSMIDDVWTSDILLLVAPGDAHSVLLFWEGPSQVFDRWYINLQSPVRRTAFGIDFTDHFLDIIVNADLSTWRWKDEDELKEALSLGLVSQTLASQIRAEGNRVIRKIQAGDSPFKDGWDKWRPNPEWPIPELPAGWDRV